MELSHFAIYELNVGEGLMALCPVPGADGNYDADLITILDWKPALVLSMTLQSELVACGATTFGFDLAQNGIDWLHLPVPDYGVPERLDWSALCARIEAHVQCAQRVLVHCRGGCGRSGMVVLRLMIAAGEQPDAALARLRATRSCAVETDAQLAWAGLSAAAGPSF
jgi:protein-tyrosine phosphatase